MKAPEGRCRRAGPEQPLDISRTLLLTQGDVGGDSPLPMTGTASDAADWRTPHPRVLFISRLAPYVSSGPSHVIANLGSAMARCGWDVHYFFPLSSPMATPSDDVTFHPLKVPGGEYAASYPWLVKGGPVVRQLVKALRPNLVYDNCCPFPFVPVYGLARDRIVTRVHHIWATDAFRLKRGVMNSTATYLGEQWLRFVDPGRVIIDSQSAKARLVAINKRGDAAKIIPPGIDLASCQRPHLERSRSVKRVLALSRLSRNKGMDTLLHAWAAVEERDDEATLCVAGTGREEKNLKRLAARLRLERVEFRGYVDEDEKWSLLNTCTVFAFPSMLEGLPVGLLEAMAVGAAIVSTRAPGVSDLLTHEVDAVLVEPGNPASLGEALLALLNDPDRAACLGDAARRAVQAYDLDRVNDSEVRYLTTMMR